MCLRLVKKKKKKKKKRERERVYEKTSGLKARDSNLQQTDLSAYKSEIRTHNQQIFWLKYKAEL